MRWRELAFWTGDSDRRRLDVGLPPLTPFLPLTRSLLVLTASLLDQLIKSFVGLLAYAAIMTPGTSYLIPSVRVPGYCVTIPLTDRTIGHGEPMITSPRRPTHRGGGGWPTIAFSWQLWDSELASASP